MGSYADPTTVKQRSGVDAADLGLTSTKFDALISTLNGQASEAIDDYCRRDFELHDGGGTGVTDAIDGNGRESIRLPGYPVRSIDSVVLGESQTTTLDASDYRVKSAPAQPDENAGILERRRAIWPDGWENVEVTYTWGYSSPPGPVERIADDLVVAALQAAAKSEKVQGASSMSLDGFSVSFDGDALRMDLDELQQATLDDYRRAVVG